MKTKEKLINYLKTRILTDIITFLLTLLILLLIAGLVSYSLANGKPALPFAHAISISILGVKILLNTFWWAVSLYILTIFLIIAENINYYKKNK